MAQSFETDRVRECAWKSSDRSSSRECLAAAMGSEPFTLMGMCPVVLGLFSS